MKIDKKADESSEKLNNNIKEDIVSALDTVYDPEIPVSIWALGLVYDIVLEPENNVKIIMTLTTPNCPFLRELLRLYQVVKK